MTSKRAVVIVVAIAVSVGCSSSAASRKQTSVSTTPPSAPSSSCTFACDKINPAKNVKIGQPFLVHASRTVDARSSGQYDVTVNRPLAAVNNKQDSVYVGVSVTIDHVSGQPEIGDDWFGIYPQRNTSGSDDGSVAGSSNAALYANACAGSPLLTKALSKAGASVNTQGYILPADASVITGCMVLSFYGAGGEQPPTSVAFFGDSVTDGAPTPLAIWPLRVPQVHGLPKVTTPPISSSNNVGAAVRQWIDAPGHRLDFEGMVSNAAAARNDATACQTLSENVVEFASDLPTPDPALTLLLSAADKAYTRASQACLIGDSGSFSTYVSRGNRAERNAEKRATQLGVTL